VAFENLWRFFIGSEVKVESVSVYSWRSSIIPNCDALFNMTLSIASSKKVKTRRGIK